MFEQWWQEHGHRYTMPITAAEDAYLAGQQAQREVDAKIIETININGDAWRLPIAAAIRRGEQG